MLKTVRAGVWQLLLCCLVYTLVGCAVIDDGMIESSSTDKTASSSFSAPATTPLGKTAASIAADHDGESGFLLLDRGRDALSWRLILADAAEKSIDIQYFLWRNDAAGKVMMQRMLAAAAAHQRDCSRQARSNCGYRHSPRPRVGHV